MELSVRGDLSRSLKTCYDASFTDSGTDRKTGGRGVGCRVKDAKVFAVSDEEEQD